MSALRNTAKKCNFKSPTRKGLQRTRVHGFSLTGQAADPPLINCRETERGEKKQKTQPSAGTLISDNHRDLKSQIWSIQEGKKHDNKKYFITWIYLK